MTRPDLRAAFFDIDGTLLPFGAHRLPDSARAALERLRENGVKIFISTGRPPSHLPLVLPALPVKFDGWVMLNGQYCFDDDGVFYKNPLPTAGLRRVVPYLAQTDIAASFSEERHSYFNRLTPDTEALRRELDQQVEDPVRSYTHATYQLSAWLSEAQEPDFLAHFPGARAVRWHPDFADVIPADGGKAVGVQKMCERFGLTLQNAVAFGDGGNDVEMLRAAAVGVAMGNAMPPVRQAADYVTAPVDQDGIALALAHFGLI